MREIKFLGTYRKLSKLRAYQYSLFDCPECDNIVEKITKDGIKAKFCSHKCYALNRKPRGSYKGSIIISGYRYIYVPQHPNSTKSGYVAEHRLIVEDDMRNHLPRHFDVHHINGNKLDNSRNNLEILHRCVHSKVSCEKKRRDKYGRFVSI